MIEKALKIIVCLLFGIIGCYFLYNIISISVSYKAPEEFRFYNNEELKSFYKKEKIKNPVLSNYDSDDIEKKSIWIPVGVNYNGYSKGIEYIYKFKSESSLDLVVVSYAYELKSIDLSVIEENKKAYSIIIYRDETKDIGEDVWLYSYPATFRFNSKYTTVGENSGRIIPTKCIAKVAYSYDENGDVISQMLFYFMYCEKEYTIDMDAKENEFINEYIKNLSYAK